MLLRGQDARAELVEAMCAQMVHRGPDDIGVKVDRGCGLGMRRLSIIDLCTGRQPISNEDGTVWVVFNGEIYNFEALRDYLRGRGHQFRTSSDTEVIVHLYEEQGEAGLAKLRGMFAIALWDSRRQELLLARDRLGKKPLYFNVSAAGLFFASELRALRAAVDPGPVDRQALRWYFLLSWIPEPATAFRDVGKVEPGCWLRYRPDGTLQGGRYWTMPEPAGPADAAEPPKALLDELREKFDEAVRIRLVADVPLGAFLSGGIDSGSVVASMARQTATPVRTFSIGFKEAGFNELAGAAETAMACRTEHHEILVEPDSVDLVSRLVRHFGEPFGDCSAIPTFVVSEFAASRLKVALSGDGGDEFFAGYPSFFAVQRHRLLDRVPKWARRAVGLVADRLPYSARGKNYLRMISRTSALERYVENTYAPYYLLERMLRTDWLPVADEASLLRAFPDQFPPGQADTLTRVLYFEATAKLASDMLTKVDRMSMAASLEVRCPFLDHELVELAARIPVNWKMRGGRGKQVLIDAIGDRLPPGLLKRPKMGFGVPLAHWFRGELRPFVREILTSQAFQDRDIASAAIVRDMLDEHDCGRRDNSYWLWSLLVLELWFRDLEEGRADGTLH